MKEIKIHNKIKIIAGESWYLLNPEDILFCVAADHSCILTHVDGHKMEIKLTLNELEQKFNTFFLINKTYLINLEHLNNVSDLENGFVLINNYHKIPIDRDKKQLLYEALSKLS
jgi:DNA-binding LytR/AlgR family response regulator